MLKSSKKQIRELLQNLLNTRKEGKKSLNDMQGNFNDLPGQAIIESFLHVSFQR